MMPSHWAPTPPSHWIALNFAGHHIFGASTQVGLIWEQNSMKLRRITVARSKR
jgi:hypothetical protein